MVMTCLEAKFILNKFFKELIGRQGKYKPPNNRSNGSSTVRVGIDVAVHILSSFDRGSGTVSLPMRDLLGSNNIALPQSVERQA